MPWPMESIAKGVKIAKQLWKYCMKILGETFHLNLSLQIKKRWGIGFLREPDMQ
jgi:hypothetical protein